RTFVLLLLAATLGLTLWSWRSNRGVSAQTTHTQHRDSKHMHMTNWMLVPTGIPGVFPPHPNSIPKFVSQFTKPPVHVAVSSKFDPDTHRNLPLYVVTTKQIRAQVLPNPFPATTVYAYGGLVNFAEANQTPNLQIAFTFPGPTFEAVRNQRFFVKYKNDLGGDLIFPNDPTIMGANVNNAPIPVPPFKPFPPGYEEFQDPIPTVAHLHGGVTPSDSDGFPEAWFTKDLQRKGLAFTSTTFEYFNAQFATTLWFHDHTLGMTRLLVEAGLEATYIIRDRNDPIAPLLPSGKFEIPLMIQDRAFNTDGSTHFT